MQSEAEQGNHQCWDTFLLFIEFRNQAHDALIRGYALYIKQPNLNLLNGMPRTWLPWWCLNYVKSTMKINHHWSLIWKKISIKFICRNKRIVLMNEDNTDRHADIGNKNLTESQPYTKNYSQQRNVENELLPVRILKCTKWSAWNYMYIQITFSDLVGYVCVGMSILVQSPWIQHFKQ